MHRASLLRHLARSLRSQEAIAVIDGTAAALESSAAAAREASLPPISSLAFASIVARSNCRHFAASPSRAFSSSAGEDGAGTSSGKGGEGTEAAKTPARPSKAPQRKARQQPSSSTPSASSSAASALEPQSEKLRLKKEYRRSHKATTSSSASPRQHPHPQGGERGTTSAPPSLRSRPQRTWGPPQAPSLPPVLDSATGGAGSLTSSAVGTFFDVRSRGGEGGGGAKELLLPEVTAPTTSSSSPSPETTGAAATAKRSPVVSPLGSCPGLEAELAEGVTGSGRILHRSSTQRLLERAAEASASPSPSSSLVLAGARGSGKSVSLATLVAWARSNDWITLWCPSASAKVLLGAAGGTYRWNDEARGWDTPKLASAVARSLLNSHAEALKSVRAPSEEELVLSLAAGAGEGGGAPSYRVSRALLRAETLLDVAEVAAGVSTSSAPRPGSEEGESSSSSIETDAAVALIAALRSPSSPSSSTAAPPFLVALDDAHCLLSPNAPSLLWERKRNQGRELIPALEIRIVRELARPWLSDVSGAGKQRERSRGLDVAAVEAGGSWTSSSRRDRRRRQLSSPPASGEDGNKKKNKPDILVVPRFDAREWDLLMQAWNEAGVRGCPPPAAAARARAESVAAFAVARGGNDGEQSQAAASFAAAAAGEAAAASAAYIVAGGAPGRARAMHAALL